MYTMENAIKVDATNDPNAVNVADTAVLTILSLLLEPVLTLISVLIPV